MNRKAKGSRNERRSRDLLRQQGYVVTKAAGSLGTFDLIAISPNSIVLCQVKTGQWPNTAEMNAIRQFKCPQNCKKIVHRWQDSVRQPDVKEVCND